MSQLRLFRRLSAVNCFYCLSVVNPNSSVTFDPSCFRCPHCGCLNRYDERGQIIGDHPAMYQEDLNQESFLRRGTPDRNHFPSTSQKSPSPFCHACQTNQTLLVNLRAAYLPEPNDPSYASRVAQLPAYITSLQHRYPPVCANCAPAVEAEIHKKDEYARTRALGGALKHSIRSRVRSNNAPQLQKSGRESLIIWRMRGVLWVTSYLTALMVLGVGAFKSQTLSPFQYLKSYLPYLVGLSILWTFWDPTYSLRQSSEINGRRIRVDGLFWYRVCQGLAWLNRLAFSIALVGAPEPWSDPFTGRAMQNTLFISFIFELSLLVISYLSINIRRPAPIRLIDSSAHRALSELASSSQSTPFFGPVPLPEQDHFATLSLNGKPVISPSTVGTNPMFGLSSLAPALHIPTKLDPSSSSKRGILQRPGSQSQPDPLDALFDPGDDSFAGVDDDEDEDEDGHGDHDRIRNRNRTGSAGLLSRIRSRTHRQQHQPRDPDAMDWEPASPVKQAQRPAGTRTGVLKDDGVRMRTQRFFPPEEPTGLEGLFMRTRLVDEDEQFAKNASDREQRQVKWGLVYGLSVIPAVGLLAGLWLWA